MARVSENSLFNHVSGKLGDIIFRNVNGRTYVSARPQSRRDTNTASQQKARDQFKKCAGYAKKAIQDADKKGLYQKGAKGGQSAYNVAMSDAYKAPEVLAIDVSNYKGKVGDSIFAKAIDDFKVAYLVVMVYKPSGSLLEIGYAEEMGGDAREWKYAVSVTNKKLAGCKVRVIATDMAGNEGEMEVVMEG